MIKRELSGFLFFGGISFGLDFLVFNGLVLLSLNPHLASAISIVVSAAANFLGNNAYTFSHSTNKSKSSKSTRFGLVALASITSTQALTSIGFMIISNENVVALNAVKVIAIVLTMGFRFVALKKFVFRL